jgi:hypothetical protein
MSLAVDGKLGKPQLFQVEKGGFSSKKQEDGSYLNMYTLTSGPTADGGPPWVIELPADARRSAASWATPRNVAEHQDRLRDDEAPRRGYSGGGLRFWPLCARYCIGGGRQPHRVGSSVSISTRLAVASVSGNTSYQSSS